MTIVIENHGKWHLFNSPVMFYNCSIHTYYSRKKGCLTFITQERRPGWEYSMYRLTRLFRIYIAMTMPCMHCQGCLICTLEKKGGLYDPGAGRKRNDYLLWYSGLWTYPFKSLFCPQLGRERVPGHLLRNPSFSQRDRGQRL